MSYRFVDSFRAGPGWSSFLVLVESSLQTQMTCTSAECTINKLLMMGRGMPETYRVSCWKKFGKLVHLFGFIINKFVTLLIHMDVKYRNVFTSHRNSTISQDDRTNFTK
jgi:hypothetical protein